MSDLQSRRSIERRRRDTLRESRWLGRAATLLLVVDVILFLALAVLKADARLGTP